ncbi:hypothetical protein D3C81_1468960 [compost metagenome]
MHVALRVQRAPRGHAGHAGHAGAPEQPHQHGFHLIVAMMGEQQQRGALRPAHAPERGVAGTARGGLDTLARQRLHGHALGGQRHLRLAAQRRAEALPLVGRRLQAVMDVQRHHAHGRGQRRTLGHRGARGMEQGDRIAPARERHGHRDRRRPARNNKGRTGLESLCDLVGQGCGQRHHTGAPVIPGRRFP